MSKRPKIEMTIDEKSVMDIVRKAIMEALTKNPTELVEAVVKEAMNQKKDSWEKETIFQAACTKMIREAATEEFKSWLDEKKELIREAIREAKE